MKKVILLILVFLIVFSGCHKKEFLDAKKQSILLVPSQKLEPFLDEKFLLDPDRRFILALQELDYFFLNERTRVTARFYENYWYIFAGEKEIGKLPRYPLFQDFWGLMSERILYLKKKSSLDLSSAQNPILDPVIQQQIDSFAPRELMVALKNIDKLWIEGKACSNLLRAATRALVYLSFQSLNTLDGGDLLNAKALATLGIARNLTDYDLAMEEALLAYNLGYNDWAHKVAASLSPQSPLVYFLKGETAELDKIALPGSAPLARYLRLLAFAKKRKEADWLKLSEELFVLGNYLLPLVKAGLTLNRFGFTGQATEILPLEIVDQVLVETGNIDMRKMLNKFPSLSSIVAAFEDSITKLDMAGPFFDGETRQSFYRTNFYSALYAKARHLLYALGSTPSASSFLSSLGNHKSPYFKDFKAWFSGLISVYSKKNNGKELSNNLMSRENCGGKIVMDTYNEIRSRFNHIHTRRLNGASQVFKKLDSRIEYRYYAVKISLAALLDMALTEELLASVVEHSTPIQFPDFHASYYRCNKDFDKLFDLLEQDWVTTDTKAWIVTLLETNEEVSKEQVIKCFAGIVKEDPGNWNLTWKFSKYLKNIHKNKEAREVIEQWLKNNNESAGFDYVNAKKEVAKLFMEEGRYQEGMRAVDPVVGSGQAGAMETKARLLSRMGKLKDALKLMDRVIERYPHIDRSRVIKAQILWENDDFENAALVLKAYPFDYKPGSWSGEIGARFYEVFKNRPIVEAENALKALIKQGFGALKLNHITYVAEKNKNLEMAFRLISHLKIRGAHNLYLKMDAYGYMKEWQGKDAAIKWIKSQSLPFPRVAVLYPYDYGHNELYWEWVPKPAPGDEVSLMIMKALAYVRSKEKNPEHKKELLDFFKGKAEEPYFAQGQYLMGLLTEKELFNFMGEAKQKCEMPYFIGIKKETQGNIYQANDWYRICMETGMFRVTEFNWSKDRLNHWARKGYFLSHQKDQTLVNNN